MARSSMKMHAYFREKMLNAMYREGSVARFIPEWAKKNGVKLEDIDQPNITIESMIHLFPLISLYRPIS